MTSSQLVAEKLSQSSWFWGLDSWKSPLTQISGNHNIPRSSLTLRGGRMIRMCLCATALIASVALSVSSSYATTVKLSGTIKDSITQKGIASAVVHLALHPWITATTDTGGNYSLSGSTPIEYSAGGLVSAQISFSLRTGFFIR